MTVVMTADFDSELAAISSAVIVNNSSSDPMAMIERLPEVSVPVASLMPAFHLRQDGTDVDHVRLLADAAGSVQLPSILLQKRSSRIIDGMHRAEVAKLRGEWSISARIVDCTDEEALVLAVKSNTLHGLPLSRTDRISSAKRILSARPDWSDRALAGITGLSAKSIASIRNSGTAGPQFDGKRLGRDGKRHPVTSGEGRRRAAEYIAAHPAASLREVARETDVSIGTVHDVKNRLRKGAEPAAHAPGQPGQSGQPLRLVPSHPASAAAGPSAAVSALHPAVARTVPRLAWPAISAKLIKDPALRYTDGGRAFLRWMAAHSMQADEWHEFIDAIPQHWLEDVGRIAASMSEEWRVFAERLGSKLQASG